MSAYIGLILELLKLLKPIIAPSEYEKYCKQLEKLEKENAERKKKIKDALVSGDISALNAILSDLLDL